MGVRGRAESGSDRQPQALAPTLLRPGQVGRLSQGATSLCCRGEAGSERGGSFPGWYLALSCLCLSRAERLPELKTLSLCLPLTPTPEAKLRAGPLACSRHTAHPPPPCAHPAQVRGRWEWGPQPKGAPWLSEEGRIVASWATAAWEVFLGSKPQADSWRLQSQHFLKGAPAPRAPRTEKTGKRSAALSPAFPSQDWSEPSVCFAHIRRDPAEEEHAPLHCLGPGAGAGRAPWCRTPLGKDRRRAEREPGPWRGARLGLSVSSAASQTGDFGRAG